MSGNRFAQVLVVLSLAAFATALVLVHTVSHQTVQGAKTDPADPDAVPETSFVRLECAAAASGPRLDEDGDKTDVGALDSADGVAEDNGFELDLEGVDVATASEVCGRLRVERATHAGELGVLGLVLAGWAAVLAVGARRRDP